MSIERPAFTPRAAAGERRQGVDTAGLWWGVLLTVAGALWLGDMSDAFPLPPAVVGAVFAAAGIGFALEAGRSPRRWWAAIPAGALLGLGALITLVDQLSVRGEWGASMLLAGTGLGFVAAYVRARGQSWAVALGVLLLAAALIVGLVAIAGQPTPTGAPVGPGFLPGDLTEVLKPFNWVLPLAVLVVGLVLVVRKLTARSTDGADR
jgi:hypothetical protein